MKSATDQAQQTSQPAGLPISPGEADSALPSRPVPQSGPSAPAVRIDDHQAQVCYANFCRVTGTPEELILDFGLNSQSSGNPREAIEIKQRLVVNYFTAKRMLHALHLSVQRHEQAFGMLETDVQKRVVGRQVGGSAG